MHPNPELMEQAIALARENHTRGDYAIAALVVRDAEIIAEGATSILSEEDPSCHAEINAIRGASRKLGSQFLEGCWLYSTYEPCPMCASCAVWAKMQGIVWGAGSENESDIYDWRIRIPAEELLRRSSPQLISHGGVLSGRCRELLLLEPKKKAEEQESNQIFEPRRS